MMTIQHSRRIGVHTAAPIFDAVPVVNGVYRLHSYCYSSPWSYHPHYHTDALEITCHSTGLHGTTAIDGHIYPIKPGSFFWIPPNVIHSTDMSQCSGGRETVALMKTEFLHRALSLFSQCERTQLDAALARIVLAYDDSAARMHRLISELSEYRHQVEGKPLGDPLHNAMDDARILFALFGEANRLEELDHPPRTENMPVRKVMDFVEANFREELCLEVIARECCISYTHLCRLFKRFTGMTVWTFVNNVRILHAKRLLKGREMNVSEVAYECGFTDPAHFSKLFSGYVGVSPKKWRQRSELIDAPGLG